MNYIETSKYNYWILPLDVGLDKNLKPQDKLVYAQILSLTKQKGYCFATNDYLSKLNNDVCKRTIINSIHNLKSNNHIRVEFDNKEKNNSKRKIFITNLKVMNNNSLLNTKENYTSHENKFYHNKNKVNNKNNSPIISYDTDGIMLWNGKRCESNSCGNEELNELEELLKEFKSGDSNE